MEPAQFIMGVTGELTSWYPNGKIHTSIPYYFDEEDGILKPIMKMGS